MANMLWEEEEIQMQQEIWKEGSWKKKHGFLNIWRTFQIWNPRKQEEEVKDITFLLPHELMDAFLQESRDLLFHTSALCKHSKEHLLHMQRIFEAPEALAMGIAPL